MQYSFYRSALQEVILWKYTHSIYASEEVKLYEDFLSPFLLHLLGVADKLLGCTSLSLDLK